MNATTATRPDARPAPPHVVEAGASAEPGSKGGASVGSGRLGLLLTIGGLLGTAAALVLLVEKIALIEDPTYVPSCSISPLLSCGSVMASEQAEVFGFPNAIIGVVGFTIVTTIGIALLAGGAFQRWLWVGLQGGTTAGVVFVHWLIFQSLYRIGALCPYCMAVWVITITLFWYTTLHVLRAGHLPIARRAQTAVRTAWEYHAVVLTAWFLAIAALILEQFWDYWSSLVT